MDARAERIRRLRRSAAVWWVWTFGIALGLLLLLAAAGEFRASMSGQNVDIHLEQSDDGSWRAAVLPEDASSINFDGRISHPAGYIVSLQERGSSRGNELGFHRRVFRWELHQARIGVVSNQMPAATVNPEALPAEAWRLVAETLERDVFADDVRRDPASTTLWDDPDFDPRFTTWQKLASGWNARVFWREFAQDALFALVAASIAAGLRFTVPLIVRRHAPGCCASCGYDLAGLASPAGQDDVLCPECGATSALRKKT